MLQLRKILLGSVPILTLILLFNLSIVHANASYDLNDKTSNGNNLTNHSTTSDSTHTAFSGSSYSTAFNGSSQYLTAANSSSLDSSTSMTIEAWVYFTSDPNTTPFTIVSKGDFGSSGTTGQYALYGPGNGEIRAEITQNGDVSVRDVYKWTGLSLTTNTWYHVALTIDTTQPSASKFALFINGASKGNGQALVSDNASSIHSGSDSLDIGSSVNLAGTGQSAYLGGNLDDLRIWNSVRNGAQISRDYNEEVTGSEAGLVAYYPFETLPSSSSSYDTNDKTSNGNDLTNHNAESDSVDTAFSGSHYSTSLSGYGQYLTAANSSSLDPSTTMTIESWVYFTSDPGTTPFTIVSKGDFGGSGTTQQYALYGPGNGEIRAAISQNGNNSVRDVYKWTGLSLTTNTWYHVALTIDASQSSGSTFVLYVNGVSKGNGTSILSDNASSIYSGSDPLDVGSSVNLAGTGQSAYLAGNLDDLRIWNTVRSSTDINNDMNSELTGSESGLVAYYPFESLLQNQITYYTANDGTNFSRSTTPISSGVSTQTKNTDGTVTININNTTGYADSGFVLYEGTIANLPDFTINGSGSQYGTNIWFDTGNDGDFFAWNGSNILTGLNGDTYALGPGSSSGSDAISGSTQFYLMSDGQNHSLSALRSGSVSGISSSTKVAVWIGNNTTSGSLSSTITSISGL